MRDVFANALLKDGKIMFWWSGDKCHSKHDFYKDFYYAGLNMQEEFATGRYRLVTQKIPFIGSDEEEQFYRQFEIHKQSKGARPY